MGVFKCPTNAVMDCPGFYEAILIFVEPISNHFRQELDSHSCERDGPKITVSLLRGDLGFRVIIEPLILSKLILP